MPQSILTKCLSIVKTNHKLITLALTEISTVEVHPECASSLVKKINKKCRIINIYLIKIVLTSISTRKNRVEY